MPASFNTNEPAPLVSGLHPMSHRPSTLTNEPTPLGSWSPFEGHCLSIVTSKQNSHSQTNKDYTSQVNVVAERCKMSAGKQARIPLRTPLMYSTSANKRLIPDSSIWMDTSANDTSPNARALWPSSLRYKQKTPGSGRRLV